MGWGTFKGFGVRLVDTLSPFVLWLWVLRTYLPKLCTLKEIIQIGSVVYVLFILKALAFHSGKIYFITYGTSYPIA